MWKKKKLLNTKNYVCVMPQFVMSVMYDSQGEGGTIDIKLKSKYRQVKNFFFLLSFQILLIYFKKAMLYKFLYRELQVDHIYSYTLDLAWMSDLCLYTIIFCVKVYEYLCTYVWKCHSLQKFYYLLKMNFLWHIQQHFY